MYPVSIWKKLFFGFGLSFILSACSSRKGVLREPLAEKTAGFLKVEIFDKSGKDITEKCAVGYGKDGVSPNLQLSKDRPHYLEINNSFEVRYIHCLINLRLYRFDFDSFKYDTKTGLAYNFGRYQFQYEYKADYTETEYFKKTQKKYKEGKLESYPSHNLSVGQLFLISHTKLSKQAFLDEFPSFNGKLVEVLSVAPKNVSKAKRVMRTKGIE